MQACLSYAQGLQFPWGVRTTGPCTLILLQNHVIHPLMASLCFVAQLQGRSYQELLEKRTCSMSNTQSDFPQSFECKLPVSSLHLCLLKSGSCFCASTRQAQNFQEPLSCRLGQLANLSFQALTALCHKVAELLHLEVAQASQLWRQATIQLRRARHDI